MEYPQKYKSDIEKAIQISKDAGSTEIYIFGSLAEKHGGGVDSDIDVAVKGIPKSKFFEVFGRLLTTLEHSIDLVCLDYNTPFARILLAKGKLLRVA